MAPRIKGRGMRGMSMPEGYLLGRIARGRGDAQLLDLRDLRGFGVGGANQAVAQLLASAGFQFYAQGLLADGETLGAGTWTRDVTFTDGDSDTSVLSLIAAAATATFLIRAPDTFGVPQTVGTIVFAALSKTGVVSWSGGTYTNPAGRAITLLAPSPADLALADVTGRVTGVGA